MLKFIAIIGLLTISLSTYSQKAGYYLNPQANLNDHHYFYMPDCPIDVHDLTNPFLNKKLINESSNNYYFILFYELSLKNLIITDGDMASDCIKVYIYEDVDFHSNMVLPLGYKAQKFKKKTLILDMVDSQSGNLLYRSWIDIQKIKASNNYHQFQSGITLLLRNLNIQPVPLN